MPLPPATVSAIIATRQIRASMPVCAARPPQTPAILRSVRLRVSRGVAEGEAGREEVAEVMSSTCSACGPGGIGEPPEPTLILVRPPTRGDHRCALGGGGDTIVP